MVAKNVEGGNEFRAVVFATIVLTVTISGLTGKPVGRLLKVLAKIDQGWLIFGANRVAIATALALKEAGEEVVLIDRNRDVVAEAQAAGLTVVQGNGLEEYVLLRAGVETRKGVIAMTPNDEVNLLFVQMAKRLHHGLKAWLVLGGAKGVTDKMIEAEHAQVLAGRKIDIALLSAMIEEGRAEVHTRKRGEAGREDGKTVIRRAGETPLLVKKAKGIEPAGTDYDGVTDVILLLPKARQRSGESGRQQVLEAK
jgi:voltage-gated potassium channel Kch